MKKRTMLKLITVLIAGVILFVMSTNVFALSDGDTNLDFFEDTTDQLDPVPEQQPETTPEPETQPEPEPEVNTNTQPETNTNNYNTNLPQAGLAEDTMMGISITLLVVAAVFAYKKVNEYKNI